MRFFLTVFCIRASDGRTECSRLSPSARVRVVCRATCERRQPPSGGGKDETRYRRRKGHLRRRWLLRLLVLGR